MTERVRVWDLPVRVFHWLLAGSFAVAYTVAESEQLRNLHVILGYTVLGLIIFRIIWGFVGSHFARFRSFMFGPSAAIDYLRSLTTKQPQRFIGHTPAGSYAIYAILLLGLATGVTGYLALNESGGESAEDLHSVFANIWLGVVIAHLAGVAVGSWVHRENLVGAMVTGYKKVARGQGGSGSGVPAGRAVGIVVAAGVATFWIWSLLTGSVPGRGERTAHEQQEKEERASDVSPAHERREAERLAEEKTDTVK